MSGPAIAVAVASHERPLRLRWLLNALAEQTLDRERFEVVVCHDSRGPETDRLLAEHPLAVAGVLRGLSLPAANNPPGRQRNVAWRASAAPIIAFTDDDCRPPPQWLERLLAAAQAHPAAIVQGTTRPDPDERALLHACAHSHSQDIDPPVAWAQTCNMAYPRDVLEHLGGFDERFEGGEDTDLACRALAAGAALMAAPEAVTYHAVEPRSLVGAARASWRWRHLPELVARHPQLRGTGSVGRHFWKPAHARLAWAVAAGVLTRRPLLTALALVPWAAQRLPSYGASPRGRLRATAELPGRALLDLAELTALAVGSVRARTLFL